MAICLPLKRICHQKNVLSLDSSKLRLRFVVSLWILAMHFPPLWEAVPPKSDACRSHPIRSSPAEDLKSSITQFYFISMLVFLLDESRKAEWVQKKTEKSFTINSSMPINTETYTHSPFKKWHTFTERENWINNNFHMTPGKIK